MPATLTPNQKTWVDALRSGDKVQTRNALKRIDHGNDGEFVVGFCCLGVATEVSGLCSEEWDGSEAIFTEPGDLDPRHYASFPPPSVMWWMGAFTSEAIAYSTDVTFDVPDEIKELPQQLTPSDAEAYAADELQTPRIGEVMSAATMNDEKFTFNQIADMIEYFGIKVLR